MISVSELEVSRLFVGESNVRRDAGDITELTASIKEKGVLHPIVVRPVAKKFEVIVGSRRFAVAKKLGLKKIPAIVRPLKDAEALIESLIEAINAARKRKKAGIKVTVRGPNNSEDRVSVNAMPKLHAIELERAFKTELVNKLPEKEKEEKYFRLARTVAPLSQP